jgi:hypothetical protein
MSSVHKLLAFRDRFRRLDRKWHVLIGSQLVFGVFLFRAYTHEPVERNNSIAAKSATISSSTAVPEEDKR